MHQDQQGIQTYDKSSAQGKLGMTVFDALLIFEIMRPGIILNLGNSYWSLGWNHKITDI